MKRNYTKKSYLKRGKMKRGGNKAIQKLRGNRRERDDGVKRVILSRRRK